MIPIANIFFTYTNTVGAALWAADIEELNTNMTDETAPSLRGAAKKVHVRVLSGREILQCKGSWIDMLPNRLIVSQQAVGQFLPEFRNKQRDPLATFCYVAAIHLDALM
ncbi:hypothetical protein E4U43_008398 [Claviceps pusilla]|uniref:Uncharacterized protein n=1 Tax=Claviceps pusilla TaxID=123648 RepID=A0A9P7SZQ6_9HYPO|nr:hypothetical protein E4U43_008398 [Claviceps pusilla]